MIRVEDYGVSIQVIGHPAHVALELEEAARAVKELFTKQLGKECGNALYEEVLVNAEKSDEERDRDTEELRKRLEKENPEILQRFDESLIKSLLDKYSKN